MIVVAIVAILAAIAYPSYRDQIERTRRADAQAVLMQAAQFMERIYTENGCYNPDDDCSGTDTDGVRLPYTQVADRRQRDLLRHRGPGALADHLHPSRYA